MAGNAGTWWYDISRATVEKRRNGYGASTETQADWPALRAADSVPGDLPPIRPSDHAHVRDVRGGMITHPTRCIFTPSIMHPVDPITITISI